MWKAGTNPKIYFTNTDDPDVVTRHTEGYYDHSAASEETCSKWVHSTTEKVPSELAKLKGKKVVGWKKAHWYDKRLKKRRHAVIELEIAARTPRVQPRNYKCRAASAKVLAIYECEPGKGKRYNSWKLTGRKLRMACSAHDEDFVYRVGARVKPLPTYEQAWGLEADKKPRRKAIKGSDKFVCDHRECSVGIHFFLTQKEALRYSL